MSKKQKEEKQDSITGNSEDPVLEASQETWVLVICHAGEFPTLVSFSSKEEATKHLNSLVDADCFVFVFKDLPVAVELYPQNHRNKWQICEANTSLTPLYCGPVELIEDKLPVPAPTPSLPAPTPASPASSFAEDDEWSSEISDA